MKKIIAMLLLMAISLSILPVYSSETVTESRQTSFLKAIGVLEKGFSENSEITKGEFTKRVVNLLYPDADFSNLNPNGAFLDVTSDSYSCICYGCGSNYSGGSQTIKEKERR